MKKLERGEKVTMWTVPGEWRFWRNADSHAPHGHIARGRVVKPWRRGALVRVRVGKGYAVQRIFSCHEGKLWVRGWDTDEALAMIVSEALR